MSLIIKIKGADYSGKGLPKLSRTIQGFPVDNLHALYLFNDGQVGESFAGPFLDSSGNANHATIAPRFPLPLKQESGLVSAGNNGFFLDTKYSGNKSFTAILVIKSNPDTSNSFLASLDAVTSNGNVNAESGYLSLTYQTVNRWRIFSNAGGIVNYDLANPPANTVSAIAITVNVTTSDIQIFSLSDNGVLKGTDERISKIASLKQNLGIGIAGYSEGEIFGELHLSAIYSGVQSDTLIHKLLTTAKSAVEERGVEVQ